MPQKSQPGGEFLGSRWPMEGGGSWVPVLVKDKYGSDSSGNRQSKEGEAGGREARQVGGQAGSFPYLGHQQGGTTHPGERRVSPPPHPRSPLITLPESTGSFRGVTSWSSSHQVDLKGSFFVSHFICT